ncbi:MAG: DUF3800 domain-containing protein [candidate division KSB1 bacterium]|nr:DUF3800 domain-containing protein [candidate division KSB1 bacterium]MDZ7303476.1 DUF3800 domain-containing protein [candidate division KSB1 bacterium]
MWYLYLDESGDLGFDFVNKKPSNFFTVTIMVVEGIENNRALINGVRRTLDRKLNPGGKRHRIVTELKGYRTSIAVKEYFYNQLAKIPFNLYSVTLNKRQILDRSAGEKHRVYNYISRLVLEAIPFEFAQTRINLIIDKSKNKEQILEFNSSVINQLLGRLDPQIPIEIDHLSSVANHGLQAVDVFSWGIFKKYESGDTEWLDMFSSRLKYDKQYP